MKTLLRIGGAVALVLMLASPALAQLRIQDARWGLVGRDGGVGRASCDARPQLVRACEGRDTCQLKADNRALCGDPAQGRVKALEVSYACNGDARTVRFDEASMVVLRCEDRRPPPPERGEESIRVRSAVWGAIGPSGRIEEDGCNATREVARACNGEGACELRVDNQSLCGDPAREREKTLEVIYSCGGETGSLSFPENARAALRCDVLAPPSGRSRGTLNISFARWGVAGDRSRISHGACNASADLANACNGKSQCQVSVYNRYLCGDPAPGEVKTLDVTYSCGGREESLRFPETTQAILRCPQRPGW